MAQMAGQRIVDEFKPSGTAYSLGIRLHGKFKTAYPDGKPGETSASEGEEAAQDKAADKSLKETTADNAVVLIGDADFLFDQFCARVQNFFGQRIIIPQFGNLTFGQAIVEQLAGDSNLIGVRSRASLSRPFTVVKELQKSANLRFQAEIKKLEEEQNDAQRRLNELQQNKEAGQRFILSPEQQQEIARFKQKETEARIKLKEVRKNLRQEIDSLENRLKWLNIAGMPVMVTIVGLFLAVIRKQRTKAK